MTRVTVRIELVDEQGRDIADAFAEVCTDPTSVDTVAWTKIVDNEPKVWKDPAEYERQSGVDLGRYTEQAIEQAYRLLGVTEGAA